MYRPMNPCPACRRHVLTTEAACPFCAAALPDAVRDHVAPDSQARMKRAAMFLFGATIASVGCASTTSAGDAASTDTVTVDTQTVDTQTVDTQTVDTQTTDTQTVDRQTADTASDVLDDRGGPAPPYGIAPPDAGVPDDLGSFKADYGAPPPRDGG